ncbi:MAG: ribonuclease Y, partial [Oribacterium sp.]
YHEPELVINAVASHHGGTEPSRMISCLVAAADAISAARPGARRKSLESYTNRLKELEDIANSYRGVERSFAVQAGREVRIMVIPELVNDDEMAIMARDISKQIQDQMQYPGVIKVNIIRESRAVGYAK